MYHIFSDIAVLLGMASSVWMKKLSVCKLIAKPINGKLFWNTANIHLLYAYFKHIFALEGQYLKNSAYIYVLHSAKSKLHIVTYSFG